MHFDKLIVSNIIGYLNIKNVLNTRLVFREHPIEYIDKTVESAIMLTKHGLYNKWIKSFKRNPDVCMNNARMSYKYALRTNSRFPMGEEIISKSAHHSYNYACKVINGPFILGENEILKYPVFTYDYIKNIKCQWSKGEETILCDLKYTLLYIKKVIGGPWPIAEPIIAKDALHSYHYAIFIGKRFIMGECAIFNEPSIIVNYIKIFIKKPFPEAEKYISKYSHTSYNYVRDIIKGPWPPGEKAIAESDYHSYDYAHDIINGSWSLGEKAIANSAYYSYKYAHDIIKGPWPPGEKTIATNAGYSYLYALNVIKGPWFLGEEAITTDVEYSFKYALNVVKRPWPPGEAIISKCPKYAYLYATDILGMRWPLGETAIATDAEYALSYAYKYIPGRWPLAEAAIYAVPIKYKSYMKHIARNIPAINGLRK